MGATEGIDLSQLAPNTITRKWYLTGARRSAHWKKCKGDVHGDVELIILWRYNSALDWDPFDGRIFRTARSTNYAAFRGRKLAIRDKNLFSAGGSSDPKLTFNLSRPARFPRSLKRKPSRRPGPCVEGAVQSSLSNLRTAAELFVASQMRGCGHYKFK